MYLTSDNKKTFKAIILLNEMINGLHAFRTIANGDDQVLEPLFIELMSKGYVQTSGMNYQVTAKGQNAFNTFMKRYTEYLNVFDVYSYVDLEKGEFAFARYFDFDSDAAWDNFKNDERFQDVRIAVALFKKIDPAEIVFNSFINENRFDTTAAGWQIDLVSDNTWAEIEDICNTAIKPEEIGTDAMEDMVKQGSDLMIKLLEEENKQKDLPGNGDNDGYTETIVEEQTTDYYRPYYRDPYYISPVWLLPLFLW